MSERAAGTLGAVGSAREVEFVFEPQDEGGYHVYAPELPGLHTQGDSLNEATENAREALALHGRLARGRPTAGDGNRPPQVTATCVSERLRVVSGAQLVGALGKLGWTAVRQRGSHVRLKHPDRPCRWWCRFTASSSAARAGILRDAGIDREELRRLL